MRVNAIPLRAAERQRGLNHGGTDLFSQPTGARLRRAGQEVPSIVSAKKGFAAPQRRKDQLFSPGLDVSVSCEGA